MEVDYERLPTENAFVHMVAGGAAGIMEHCVMYPVDIVKVTWKSNKITCVNLT
jgi:solute carrier family 25 iron transporter 28/37